MIITLAILFAITLAVLIFLQDPRFGKAPGGERLRKIEGSTHYRNGQFMNTSITPSLTEGASYIGVMNEFFFSKNKRAAPSSTLPSVKSDLFKLAADRNLLVWFGHSSYFMQLDGKRFLVDPVLSGHASPLPFTTRSFKGSDVFSVDDIPPIDCLFISHDHYDHLDHKTMVQLRPKVSKIVTGLGVGAHLERWGYDASNITELDWDEKIQLDEGFNVQATTARHFSGRTFKRNNTLWLSFILRTPSKNIFIGGDSGYDGHFKAVGDTQGPFDLAILENGQYNRNWKYIHMMPEEVVQAAMDLRARTLLPVHWSKFSLSLHAWDEPIIRVVREAEKKAMPVIHPMIGQVVDLDAMDASTRWWEGLE